MAGIYADRKRDDELTHEERAKWSVEGADALIAALNKTTDKPCGIIIDSEWVELRKGDKIEDGDEYSSDWLRDRWKPVEPHYVGQTIVRRRTGIRRRNPNYKPPFVPRVATWDNVRVGAVIKYGNHGIAHWKVTEQSESRILLVGPTGEVLSIHCSEINRWTLIQPAPGGSDITPQSSKA